MNVRFIQKHYGLVVSIVIACILSVAAVVVLTLQSNSDSDRPLLRVGLYENEPKIFTNTSGEPDGLFVELLNAIARSESWRIEYEPCVWQMCLEMLDDGMLDLMPDVAFSSSRDERFDFHQQPVVQSWSQVYARTGTSLVELSDLLGRRVAVLEGSVQETYLSAFAEERGSAIELVQVSSFEAGFAQVEAGQADAVIANNFYGSRHRGDYDLFDTPITFDLVGLFFATAAENQSSLLLTIDDYLRTWQADPESPYYRALARAVSPPVEEVVPRWLQSLAMIMAGGLLLLIIVVYGLRWTIRQQTTELRQANARFAHLLNGSPVMMYALRGHDLSMYWVSSNAERLFGLQPDMLIEPGGWEAQIHPEDRDLAMSGMQRVLTQEHSRHDYRILDRQGRVRYVQDEKRLVRHRSDPEIEVIGTVTDVTDRHEQEARLSFLNHYDTLTGLPNRTLLLDRLDHAVNLATEQGYPVSVVFIDLDRFKTINDAQGIRTGDWILRQMANRIRQLFPLNTLARLSADEFVLVIERPQSTATLEQRIMKLIAEIKKPWNLEDQTIMLTASVGVASIPDDASAAESVVSQAELAMASAKQQGGDTWRMYAPSLRRQTEVAFKLENALRFAVERQQLLVYYQPQFRLSDHTLVGVEALVRWQHPDMGMIPPNQFIPLAESIGVIQDIDQWVMQESCRQLQRWQKAGLNVPKVAVNVSAVELDNPTLPEQIQEALRAADLPPDRLVLEVTESMLMRAPDSSATMLEKLKSLGIKIAMDDFGTGYSNLVSLHQLPLDCLKIDQSFVQDIGRSGANESITLAIIAMGQALNLELVAEGIETAEQKAFVMRAGCATGQGYLLSRPMSADQLLKLAPTTTSG